MTQPLPISAPPRLCVSLFLFSGLVCPLPAQAAAPNYQDQILPIFRTSCLNCHNPDKKKAGLDLSTYAAAMEGSSGQKVISPGNPDESPLYQTVAHTKEPQMPKGGDKLPAAQIQTIRDWIAGGLLESASGRPMVANGPKVDLSVVTQTGKPARPSAMPVGLSTRLAVLPRRNGPVQSLAASPWAPVLAVGSPRQVLLFNSDTLELLGVLPFPDGDVTAVRFSRNGNVLLAAGGAGAKSGRVALFDVATGKTITTLGDEFDEIISADILPDQAAVVIGTTTRMVKTYTTADGKLARSIKKHTDWVTAVAASPDGRSIASGDRAGNLYLWDARNGNELLALPGHKAQITALSFRDDGKLLASASEDVAVKLWNPADGSNAKTIAAHATGVTWVDFTHDGRLVTTGRDSIVKLWKPDGSPLKSPPAMADIALRAVFTHDGGRIFAGDFTGEIRAFATADAAAAGSLSITIASPEARAVAQQTRLDELSARLDAANTELKKVTAAQAAATSVQAAARTRLAETQRALDAAKAATPVVPAQVAAATAAFSEQQRVTDTAVAAVRAANEAVTKARQAALSAATQFAAAKSEQDRLKK